LIISTWNQLVDALMWSGMVVVADIFLYNLSALSLAYDQPDPDILVLDFP
jgi:homogentisate 1,2-dioxygenase